MFLFQRLSVALQRGNAVSFVATFANSEVRPSQQSYIFAYNILACRPCASGRKKNKLWCEAQQTPSPAAT